MTVTSGALFSILVLASEPSKICSGILDPAVYHGRLPQRRA